jgi:hypothetical protein
MQRSAPIDTMLAEVAEALPNVATVFPARNLCSADACEVYLDDEFLYRDPSHIRRNLNMQTRRDFADKIGLTQVLVAR